MHIIKKVNDYVQNTDCLYGTLGIFGFICYFLYYLIWTYYAPIGYENFLIRLIASLLCLPLIFYKYYPQKYQVTLPYYYYFTLLYCLPFFFTFMLLKNQFSDAWTLNTMTGIVLSVLLLDTLSLIFIVPLGCIMGWLLFHVTTPHPEFMHIDYKPILVTYLSVFIFGAIFAHNKDRLKRQKIDAIKTMAASIAHELRTPLTSINEGAKAVKEYLPKLVSTYELAKKEKLQIDPIQPRHIQGLEKTVDNIDVESRAAQSFINMLLMNVKDAGAEAQKTEFFSLLGCAQDAIERYPMSRSQRGSIHCQEGVDFLVCANSALITHVLFNLIKNSLYYVAAKGDGEILIWLEEGDKQNYLHFKDTGTGIPEHQLPHIFEHFFSQTPHGTGIGLAFCMMVMKASGGSLTCKSQHGEFTEFVLGFPKPPSTPP